MELEDSPEAHEIFPEMLDSANGPLTALTSTAPVQFGAIPHPRSVPEGSEFVECLPGFGRQQGWSMTVWIGVRQAIDQTPVPVMTGRRLSVAVLGEQRHDPFHAGVE